uniref:Ig-like domain-containing protein n=1 Tax=Hucho hucho TaxID=62062 RepID=A0A4W5PVI2_9TELE
MCTHTHKQTYTDIHRHTQTFTDRTLSFHVPCLQGAAVSSEDAGVYVCQAQNTEGVAEVKVEVIVEGGATAPKATVSMAEVTAVEGQATGSPLPVVSWSKLRAPLPWQHTVEGGVLTLTSVGRQDSGQYICNATNTHGYSQAYTQLEVDCEYTHTNTHQHAHT